LECTSTGAYIVQPVALFTSSPWEYPLRLFPVLVVFFSKAAWFFLPSAASPLSFPAPVYPACSKPWDIPTQHTLPFQQTRIPLGPARPPPVPVAFFQVRLVFLCSRLPPCCLSRSHFPVCWHCCSLHTFCCLEGVTRAPSAHQPTHAHSRAHARTFFTGLLVKE
jgi:hypothetical protein